MPAMGSRHTQADSSSASSTSAHAIHDTISKQRAKIARLQEENSRLQQELDSGKENTPAEKIRICQLTETLDSLQRKIEMERRQVSLIENETAVARAKVASSRQQATHDGHDNIAAKHINALEARLQRSKQKFSECIARNKHCRQEMTQIQKEITLLRELHAKMTKELQQKKDESSILQQSIEAAKEAACEAVTGAATLVLADDKEQQLHDEELSHLEKLKQADEKFTKARQPGGEAGPADVDLDFASIGALWTQLQDVAGCSSREQVVAKMKAAEDQSFQLFETCKRLDAKAEDLQQEIAGLEVELKEHEQHQGMAQATDLAQQMDSEANQLRKRAESYNEKQLAVQQRIVSLKPAIFAVAEAAGITLSTTHVSSSIHNELLQYLSQIESRARIIVAVYKTLGME